MCMMSDAVFKIKKLAENLSEFLYLYWLYYLFLEEIEVVNQFNTTVEVSHFINV